MQSIKVSCELYKATMQDVIETRTRVQQDILPETDAKMMCFGYRVSKMLQDYIIPMRDMLESSRSASQSSCASDCDEDAIGLEEYRKEVEEKENEIRELQAKMDERDKFLRLLIEQQNSSTVKLYQDNQQELKSRVESLSALNTELEKKLAVHRGKATSIGKVGELFLQNLFTDRINDITVMDTGMTTLCADLHIHYDTFGSFISVESKNHDSIRQTHITHTLEAVANMKQIYKDQYVGHMFVSLRAKNITGKGDIHFEVDPGTNVPIMWLGFKDAENSEFEQKIIISAFQLLRGYISQSRKQEGNNEAQHHYNLIMKQQLSNVIKTLGENISIMNQLQNHHARSAEDLGRLQKNILQLFSDCQGTMSGMGESLIKDLNVNAANKIMNGGKKVARGKQRNAAVHE